MIRVKRLNAVTQVGKGDEEGVVCRLQDVRVKRWKIVPVEV